MISQTARRHALAALLAGTWLLFAESHLMHWYRTGQAHGIGMMVVETFVAALFILRREPLTTSRSWTAWAATAVGTFGPLAIRPSAESLPQVAAAPFILQLVGAALALMGLFAIGRSFGLVAANRGIKTRGPYGLVRHPVYAGYLVVNTGYLLENPTVWNSSVLFVALVAQLIRVHCEEEVLSSDPAYTEYRRRVRYRLVPLVY